jgi:hypothetical protein
LLVQPAARRPTMPAAAMSRAGREVRIERDMRVSLRAGGAVVRVGRW